MGRLLKDASHSLSCNVCDALRLRFWQAGDEVSDIFVIGVTNNGRPCRALLDVFCVASVLMDAMVSTMWGTLGMLAPFSFGFRLL